MEERKCSKLAVRVRFLPGVPLSSRLIELLDSLQQTSNIIIHCSCITVEERRKTLAHFFYSSFPVFRMAAIAVNLLSRPHEFAVSHFHTFIIHLGL